MSDKPTSSKRKPTPKPNKGEWTTVDTAGMTPEQIAATAESLIVGQKRKPRARHNDASAQEKVSKKPGLDKPIVKSGQKAPANKKQPAEKRPPGRATTYTEAAATKIIERLSNGEPLRQICRDDNMPAWTTVYNWMKADTAFAERITHARDIGGDAIAEEIIDILDQKPERTATEFGDKVDPGFVQWQKNRAEQRLKLLAKWNPKKYGDRVDLNHGGQAGNPVEVRTKVVMVPEKKPALVETKPLTKPTE